VINHSWLSVKKGKTSGFAGRGEPKIDEEFFESDEFMTLLFLAMIQLQKDS